MAASVSQREKNRKLIRFIVFNGIVAALYIVLTYFLEPISYGIVQARVSEAMTVFPIFSFNMIPGLVIGCLVSNLINPNNLGPVDIIFGTLATLIAGIFSRIIGRKNMWLGVIPPIVANGVIVGGYLPFLLYDAVTWQIVLLSMLSVAAGEAVVLIVLGLPLVAVIGKTGLKKKLP
ncbi:MAG: QueT transporter family protein [Clostridiales bacterium]|nr:QueT transporter family protein [Clostridiales bacterium]